MEMEKTAGAALRDAVVVEGINARGFGTVPKAVMRDPALPVEAKAIYAYLCSFAGGGQAAFPARATMLAELRLSKDRFYKYRAMLVERGVLRVERRSEGNVAHPVRTNVYVLAATMPECYRDAGTPAAPAPGPAAGDTAAAASPQVGDDVLVSRTPPGGFPQPAGRERRPGNKDVVETGTTKRPGNKDIGSGGFPRPDAENADGIKNRVRVNPYPPARPGCHPSSIEREFSELSSPAVTPNRNRIPDALAPYAALRSRFPAGIIQAAWRRRQAEVREAGRPARFYPQLARWLEDPGPEGAAVMCDAAVSRESERLATKVVVKLSLDERYMAMRSEALDLAALADSGTASEAERSRLALLEARMLEARIAARAEVERSSAEGRGGPR